MDQNNDAVAGPSGVQRPKRVFKNDRKLTDEELEMCLNCSDTSEHSFSVDVADSDADSNYEGEEPNETDSDDSSASPDDNSKLNVASLGWQSIPTGMKTFPFSKSNKMLVDLPTGGKPIDYFLLLMDDHFLNHIVNETNKYALQTFLYEDTKPRSRLTLWKELTVPEFLKFLGLLFHTGTIKLATIQEYWKVHRLYNLKCFSDHMSRDRFLLILRYLHFNSNPAPDEDQSEDRLYKVRPVIDFFNKKMLDIYYPGKEMAVDESMVLWRGRLVFRQFIKNKRHKYGIKLYMMTEPDGTILKVSVYTGQLDDMGGKGHTEKVVLHLVQEKLNNGHSLYLDNFYNSVHLASVLLSNETYCTGTLRANRIGNPVDVISAKLRRGKTIVRYSDGILVGKWKDQRDVLYISTEFTNNMIEKKTEGANQKKNHNLS